MLNRLLLFVESNTTGTGMLALGAAVRLGYAPVFLTADPSRYAGLRETGAQVIVCDTGSPERVLATVSGLGTPSSVTRGVAPVPGGVIAGVTTTSEFFLPAVAVLARELGLPGNPAEVVRACRNKAAVRQILDEAGIAQPRWATATSDQEADSALALTGLPCVVKPVDDSGSSNVRVCRDRDEVLRAVQSVLAVRLNSRGQPTAGLALIEEYVSGPEFSVEMFSADGEAHCVGVTRKSVGPPPYRVETGHLHPAGLPAHEQAVLAETVREILKILGVRTGPTHTEVKAGPSGPALIEVNCRLAGGMIPELVRHARGIDLVEQQLRCAVGEVPDLSRAPGCQAYGWAGIRFLAAGRSGVLRGFSGLSTAQAVPGVVQATTTARAGARVNAPRDAYGRLGFVIAAGTSPDEVMAALAEAESSVSIVLE
jgi:S-sulfo-L-cysteine synthase (3-phospho-L-serine-dependent)